DAPGADQPSAASGGCLSRGQGVTFNRNRFVRKVLKRDTGDLTESKKTKEEMLEINRAQARFYDSISEAEDVRAGVGYAHHTRANLLTRVWAALRYRQQQAATAGGIEARKDALHREWMETQRGGRFLEIGCFRGTPHTSWLIEAAGEYLGVELSPKAVAALQERIQEAGMEARASVRAMDFLTLAEDEKFDLIFAHGVLHHFANPDPAFEKISNLLKNDGVLILTEPAAVGRLHRFLRALYRPFQSDSAWEWPFTRETVRSLERYLSPVAGFGWGRRSFLLSVIVGVPVLNTLLLPVYCRLLNAEVEAGWHEGVWTNSTVTAVYRLK
ncbi:MAG: SAM-dependent methyltransferase, partial [Longimicrobiales bacterium]